MALLRATEHAQPVEPFRGETYYSHIMAGKPWTPVQRGRGGEFTFEKADRPALAAAATGGIAPAECQPEAAPIEDGFADDNTGGLVSAAAMEPSSSDSSSSSSSDTSCTATSSNYTGSEGDDGEGDDIAAAVPMIAGLAGTAAAPAISAAHGAIDGGASGSGDAGASGSGGGGGPAMDTTFFWHGFKFTRTYRDTEKKDWVGYEVTCYLHDERGLACRRRRAFGPHGGCEVATRMLKAWCVNAWGHADAKSHKAEGDCKPPPGDDDLEAARSWAPESKLEPQERMAKRPKKG